MNSLLNRPPPLLDRICITVSTDTEVVTDNISTAVSIRSNSSSTPPIISHKYRLALMPNFLPIMVRAVTNTGGVQIKRAEAGEWAMVVLPRDPVSVGSLVEVSSGSITVEGQPTLTSFIGRITRLQTIFQTYFLFRVTRDVTDPRSPSLNLFVPVAWASVPWFIRARALIRMSVHPLIEVAPPPPPQDRVDGDTFPLPTFIINVLDDNEATSDAGASDFSGEDAAEEQSAFNELSISEKRSIFREQDIIKPQREALSS